MLYYVIYEIRFMTGKIVIKHIHYFGDIKSVKTNLNVSTDVFKFFSLIYLFKIILCSF